MKFFARLRAPFRLSVWPILLLGVPSFAHASLGVGSSLAAAPTGKDQVNLERHAMRLLAGPDLQQELQSLETKWKARWPGLLPSTLYPAGYDSLHDEYLVTFYAPQESMFAGMAAAQYKLADAQTPQPGNAPLPWLTEERGHPAFASPKMDKRRRYRFRTPAGYVSSWSS